jgi:hypothetical protein
VPLADAHDPKFGVPAGVSHANDRDMGRESPAGDVVIAEATGARHFSGLTAGVASRLADADRHALGVRVT